MCSLFAKDADASRLKTFIQAKSFHGFSSKISRLLSCCSDSEYDSRKLLLTDKGRDPDSDSESEFAADNSNKPQEETHYLGKNYFWLGKDYANTFVEDFKDLDDYLHGWLKRHALIGDKVLYGSFLFCQTNSIELLWHECLGGIRAWWRWDKARGTWRAISFNAGTNAR